MQKTRQAMNLLERRHPLEKIAENVQRGVAEIVSGMQTGKCESVNLPNNSAIPKLIEARSAKPHEVFIPEAEMKFETDRHFGIEDVETRRPSGVRHHRWQLVFQSRHLLPLGRIA